MTAAVAAMITAAVGVLGTLFAPLVTHRASARQRAEEREEGLRRLRFEERRAVYTAMNRASQQFTTLLKDAGHRLRDGVYGDEERAALEEARLEHRDRYAEAQMIASERILKAYRAVNRVLADVDGAVKRIDRGLAREDESAARLLPTLREEADRRLREMQRLMREDLGIRE
ncbi:hypothetical protein ACFWIY_34290 [Streptomyces sioyaensis]|uniref:hypothetical protein n=1 Tax=Streptomyces sioyaensis TaxID=67364 RepID=UPI00365D3186